MASKPFKLIDGNVVKNYRWSVNKKFTATFETPIIEIQEYQQTVSSIRQSMEYWANQAKGITPKGKVQDPYAGLYAIDRSAPGNFYIFPFYSTYHHAIQNSWGENKGIIGQFGSDVANAITQGARVIFPSAGIEAAKSFEGAAPRQYQFTFQLLNTVDPNVDIDKNFSFIDALVNNNLLDKIDFIAIRPPAICEIKIPGARGTTVGVLSTINIENIGQLNSMYVNNGYRNIPDAYQITITVQELLTESRQIFSDDLKGGKVFADVKQETKGVKDIKEGKLKTDVLNLGENLKNKLTG